MKSENFTKRDRETLLLLFDDDEAKKRKREKIFLFCFFLRLKFLRDPKREEKCKSTHAKHQSDG